MFVLHFDDKFDNGCNEIQSDEKQWKVPSWVFLCVDTGEEAGSCVVLKLIA